MFCEVKDKLENIIKEWDFFFKAPNGNSRT